MRFGVNFVRGISPCAVFGHESTDEIQNGSVLKDEHLQAIQMRHM